MPPRGEIQGQDWQPVVFGGRGVGGSARSGNGRGGRAGGGGGGGEGKKMAALEAETEELRNVSVPLSVQRALEAARTASNMTRDQLAQKLSLPVQTIRDHETGRCLPDNAYISKVERALNTRLPRVQKAKK